MQWRGEGRGEALRKFSSSRNRLVLNRNNFSLGHVAWQCLARPQYQSYVIARSGILSGAAKRRSRRSDEAIPMSQRCDNRVA